MTYEKLEQAQAAFIAVRNELNDGKHAMAHWLCWKKPLRFYRNCKDGREQSDYISKEV